MKQCLLILGLSMMILLNPLFAQDKEASEGEEYSMPTALSDDAWYAWMAGEWEGETESTIGKMQDWMKCEFVLDNHFMIVHYTSKVVELNTEALQQMGMTAEQIEGMKDHLYKGMGIMTFDPQTGKSKDFWFDNYRAISEGSGTREGNISTGNWEGTMGTFKRTLEKVNDDEMVMNFKGFAPDGTTVINQGKTTMKRKALMGSNQ